MGWLQIHVCSVHHKFCFDSLCADGDCRDNVVFNGFVDSTLKLIITFETHAIQK